jgi:GDPmannose 4,6-dehydratase
LATNRTETVRNFVELAFAAIDVSIAWEGKDEREVGRCASSGKELVRVNPAYYRPAEVELLIGDPSKAKQLLGWEAETALEQLCEMMVEADIRRNKAGLSF